MTFPAISLRSAPLPTIQLSRQCFPPRSHNRKDGLRNFGCNDHRLHQCAQLGRLGRQLRPTLAQRACHLTKTVRNLLHVRNLCLSLAQLDYIIFEVIDLFSRLCNGIYDQIDDLT